MLGAIAPTDSRRRPDQRRWEEGREAEADQEKKRLEAKQREARKKREEAEGGDGCTWEPNFFTEEPHPYLEGERFYKFNDDNSYWLRREAGSWRGLPDLF